MAESIQRNDLYELERLTQDTMVDVDILIRRLDEISESRLNHVEVEEEAEGLSHLISDYFDTLSQAWLVIGEDEDGSDDVLSQFEMSHYNSTGDVEEDGEETDDCCICLERLYRGLVATLNCRHEFHGGCIGRWLRRGHNFCPLCKARAIKTPSDLISKFC